MRQRTYWDEVSIKACLIEQVGGSGASSTFIAELPFQRMRTRADLVSVGENYATAFEIKSGRDSLTRLARQADALIQVFDYVVVVVEPCHVAAAADILPARVGLWQCDSGSISILKSAKRLKWDSRARINWLPKKKLQVLLDSDVNDREALEVRALRLSRSKIGRAFIAELTSKYAASSARCSLQLQHPDATPSRIVGALSRHSAKKAHFAAVARAQESSAMSWANYLNDLNQSTQGASSTKVDFSGS